MTSSLLFSNLKKLNEVFLLTYSGDGQGHVEVLAPLQSETPWSRSIQSHAVSHFVPLSQGSNKALQNRRMG